MKFGAGIETWGEGVGVGMIIYVHNYVYEYKDNLLYGCSNGIIVENITHIIFQKPV